MSDDHVCRWRTKSCPYVQFSCESCISWLISCGNLILYNSSCWLTYSQFVASFIFDTDHWTLVASFIKSIHDRCFFPCFNFKLCDPFFLLCWSLWNWLRLHIESHNSKSGVYLWLILMIWPPWSWESLTATVNGMVQWDGLGRLGFSSVHGTWAARVWELKISMLLYSFGLTPEIQTCC